MWSSSSRPGACCKNQHPPWARIRAFPPGDLGEWFKPAVLKTADGQPSVSSNLTVSARTQKNGPSRPVFSFPLPTPPPPKGAHRPPLQAVRRSGQPRCVGCDGRQVLGPAHLLAVGQPDPHACSADDDVVNTDLAAFVEKLRSGFVQDHSCYVASGCCPTMTGSRQIREHRAAASAIMPRASSKNPQIVRLLWRDAPTMPSAWPAYRDGQQGAQKKARGVRAEHLLGASGRDVEGVSTG